MGSRLTGRHSGLEWTKDPVRVFAWMQMWNHLLCRSRQSTRKKSAFVVRRALALGVDRTTLETAVSLFLLNQEAEATFATLERQRRRVVRRRLSD